MWLMVAPKDCMVEYFLSVLCFLLSAAFRHRLISFAYNTSYPLVISKVLEVLTDLVKNVPTVINMLLSFCSSYSSQPSGPNR